MTRRKSKYKIGDIVWFLDHKTPKSSTIEKVIHIKPVHIVLYKISPHSFRGLFIFADEKQLYSTKTGLMDEVRRREEGELPVSITESTRGPFDE